jgi:hypothetical protein
MKKKFREITVDGKKYGWTLHNDCDGDGGNCIEIWYNKKIIHKQLISGDIQITPKIISNIIIVFNENQKCLKQYTKYLIDKYKNLNDYYFNTSTWRELISFYDTGMIEGFIYEQIDITLKIAYIHIYYTEIVNYAKANNKIYDILSFSQFELLEKRKNKINGCVYISGLLVETLNYTQMLMQT